MSDIKELPTPNLERFSGNSSNNKALYVVVMEDPTVKGKVVNYFAKKISEKSFYLELTGYEVNTNYIAQMTNAKTFEDAVELARDGNKEQQIVYLPWNRILRIKKYLLNSAGKESK